MSSATITPTALQYLLSRKFWQQRCVNQLKYIQIIEVSDRRIARKIELQLSALEVYRFCLDHLDEIGHTAQALDDIDRSLSAELKESRLSRKKR